MGARQQSGHHVCGGGWGWGWQGPCRAGPQALEQPHLHILCNVTDAFPCLGNIERQTCLRDKGFFTLVCNYGAPFPKVGCAAVHTHHRSPIQFIDLTN